MKQEYTQSAGELLQQLDVTAQGLSGAQAAERLQKYGPNRLKEAPKPTLLQRFIEQLKDPMLIILMVAAAVSAVTNYFSGEGFAEVFIILIVVLLNAILGVYQAVSYTHLDVYKRQGYTLPAPPAGGDGDHLPQKAGYR